MPTQIRDDSPERRRDEKRHSKSDRDKDRDKSDRKDRPHKSLSRRKSSTKERESSRTSLSSSEPKKKHSIMPGVVIEENMESATDSKTSLPYPTFSKAHSKEAVGSRPSLDIFTPPATDVESSKDRSTQPGITHLQNGPPSPPLTDKTAGRPRTTTLKSAKKVDTIPEESKNELKERKEAAILRQKSCKSSGHLRSSSDVGTSIKPTKSRERVNTPLKNVQAANKSSQRSVSQPMKVTPTATSPTATEITTNDSSDATSIAPEQPKIQRPGSKVPPAAMVEDMPIRAKTPATQPVGRQPTPATQSIPHGQTPIPQSVSRQQTPLDIVFDSPVSQYPATSTPGPPPPPPAPVVPLLIPKVDYLLHHGGLGQAVPKNLLYAGKPMAVQQAQTASGLLPPIVSHLFEPYNRLLEDFERVISKNGSLAVATGYRSVARRLLDRLEAVFARDISSEDCVCCMCTNEMKYEDSRGVSWGEILELVSGRRDLPNWPPFAFFATPSGLGISLDIQAPMQKMDIDVPEEYREHYIRQSRKTKQSVDKWLSRQGDDPSSPPDEFDDETLTFAILTHLPAEQRPLFKDLLGIIDRPIEPPRRAPSPDSQGAPKPLPTPQPRVRPEPIINAGLAIQRLYKLGVPPRDAETAIFLLNNPPMHNALATLAAISADEWDILISGRFDGFLRSGAEDIPEQPMNGRYTPQRAPSRGATPLYGAPSRPGNCPSRQSTPASTVPQHGAPIALDEETEIATLAEIERDIYSGMESLEDAFEVLHQKAEIVRRAIRERSAGLAAAAQRRRGNSISNIEIRMGTPASGTQERWDSETDDGLGWEGASDIAPDDSASNISSSRKRRPKRRNERRTPAMIDEEDEEDYAESERSVSPRKR